MSELVRFFLQHHPGAHAASADRLAEALSAGFALGQERWPTVALSAERFALHVATQLPPGEADPVQALRALHLDDLYLTAACLAGQTEALLAFDSEILSQVPAFAARFRLSAAQLEDLRHGLRERLLFGAARDGQRLLSQYSGSGGLKSWVRVVVVRSALDLLRDKDEMLSQSDGDARVREVMAEKDDPELRYLRTRYKTEYEHAVKEAFNALSDEQRSVMQLYYVDGLNTRQIARLFHVNATTASRWVAGARETIARETRRILQERLHVTDGELESIYRAIRSQLAVSIRSALIKEHG